MISNTNITIFHKEANINNSITEKWTKKQYMDVWLFVSKEADINAGITKNYNAKCRIPIKENTDLVINEGDILAEGLISNEINTPKELKGDFFEIKKITINKYGNNPHINIGAI